MSDEAWSISAGLKPHPDELRLDVRVIEPGWDIDGEEYPESGIIAMYPQHSTGADED